LQLICSRWSGERRSPHASGSENFYFRIQRSTSEFERRLISNRLFTRAQRFEHKEQHDAFGIDFVVVIFGMSGCIHRLTVSAADGERLVGRYRFGRDGSGLVQLVGPNGEVLMGKLFRVQRATFIEGSQKTFGKGSIAVDGPEVSFAGNGFSGIFGNSSALKDAA
jgi:hypothetical protein